MIYLDGVKAAASLQEKISQKCQKLKTHYAITPMLAALRIGEDAASILYLNRKRKKAQECGINFQDYIFPENCSFAEIEKCIGQLNTNPQVHAILLQLPLPKSWNVSQALALLDPRKDVDGLHPVNQGKIFAGLTDGFTPCTPLGCLYLLRHFNHSLAGKEVVVVGRSLLVGRPLAMLLLNQNATVTLAHSQTPHLEKVTSRADILCSAVGKPHFIDQHHVKPGAWVIDVGINRCEDGTLKGDVYFDQVKERAGALTPVPGGVGPMTVITLMENTLKAAIQNACPFFS